MNAGLSQPLIDRVAAGELNAVARAISKVEDGAADSAELMKQIFPRTGRALIIGITGSTGSRGSHRWLISWLVSTGSAANASALSL